MKIRAVAPNNRRRVFEVRLASRVLSFPYAKANPRPSSGDPVETLGVDEEVAREAFWYVLASGARGYVHVEQVLEYNLDPSYMRDQLLYRLTLEAQRQLAKSPLARREIIRRLGTSAAQFYRLVDQTNYRKSIDHVLALLQVLECKVELVIHERGAA
jgi:Cro/C1-type HTH DNA-binding domain